MAKFYRLLAIGCWLSAIAGILTACQEGREAGDLWGQWQLDGSDSQFISFSGSVTQLKNIGEGEVYGNFQHQGDSLFMQYYSKKGEKTDTIVVEQSFGFRPFNNVRVRIATLDNDHLVLTKDNRTWSFCKY